jgi:hypothetical protein
VIGAYDASAACNNIVGSDDVNENENVIVRLAVNTRDPVGSSTEKPCAYNTHPNGYNTFQSMPLEFAGKRCGAACDPAGDGAGDVVGDTACDSACGTLEQGDRIKVPDPIDQDVRVVDGVKLKVVELLTDFEMKSKNEEWPTSTSICCYWCCNPFDSVPFGIPVKYIDDKFHVFGCFCNLECAAAYNFESGESHDERWERYHLINLLSHKIGHVDRVRAAPSRLALKMFGGYMDLEEFRSFARTTTKVIGINFPPMMTLTQQIEELHECDVSSEYKYIPIDIDRINKYREKIVLRRNKPVTEFRNTLDSLMNLKIHS